MLHDDKEQGKLRNLRLSRTLTLQKSFSLEQSLYDNVPYEAEA